MMRENAAAKAVRLLAEKRVMVIRAGPEYVLAAVRGDSAQVYWVEWISGRWTCTCDARSRCSHGLAVQGVVVVGEDFQQPLVGARP